MPFITPVLLTLGFWRIFSNPVSIYWIAIASVVLIVLTGKILARHNFIRFFRLWINLAVVYIAQVLFMILLTSDSMRYWLAIIWLIIWNVVFWLLYSYFSKLKDINDLDYLSFNRFLYYLAFWLLSCSLFYLIVFINFSVIYSIIIMLIAIYIWSREIMIFTGEQLPRYFIWLLLLTSLEILLALYLMPLSFYVAGTIATLWIFFVLELLLLRSRHFIRYLSLFLAVVGFLLISSIL
jgi:hypothetical protein